MAAGLIGFLSEVRAGGTTEALRRLRIPELAGRPIQDIFVALADVLCPDGGAIDEGIARDAFIETIADCLEAGIVDLAKLTVDQMFTIFEMFVARSIERRLHNDIGTRTITLPANNKAVQAVQDQVYDFIRGRVHDAIHGMRDQLTGVRGADLDAIVERVYIESFDLMYAMAEARAR